jgi:hypothetical protein
MTPQPMQPPPQITPEQLQAWVARRDRFWGRIRWIAVTVLIVAVCLVAAVWSLFHDQLMASASLKPLGFMVDWNLELANLKTGGDTSVSYLPGLYVMKPIVAEDLKPLKKLLHLKSLDIGNLDTLGDADLAILAELTELRDLEIHRANPSFRRAPGRVKLRVKLTDGVIEHIKGLKRLKSLSLAENRITDAGLARLANLTELESLDLDNTKITDASIETLKGFKRLRFLRVVGTKITKAGAITLQQAMPMTEVTRDEIIVGPTSND